MSLAVRRPDGTKVSTQEIANMRHRAHIICQKLLKKLISSHPAYASDSRLRTKTFLKSRFKVEYNQAILDLEVAHKLLRLCSAHWKADHLIGQALSRRTGVSTAPDPSDVGDSQPAAPMNAAKRALELSPGPKSPSVSHTQKRSKDTLSGQKTAGSIGGLNREYLT
jgi:hypothetical protein